VRRSNTQANTHRLAALLRDIRVQAGLRQVDVAERLGQPQSYVSKYEAGERRIDLVELRKICAALETDMVKLVAAFEGRSVDS